MTVFLTLLFSHLIALNSIYLYQNSKSFEWLKVWGFDKSIRNVVFYKYVSSNNFFRLNFFPDLIVFHFNIFGMLIKLLFTINGIVFLLLVFGLIFWSNSLYLRVAKNQAIHKVFFLAFIVAIYSALVKKRVTIGYCFG